MKRHHGFWCYNAIAIWWCLVAAMLISPITVCAKTFTVTRKDDFNFPGPGYYCLRTAILAANEHAGPDTIVLGSGTHTLDIGGAGEDKGLTGDLDITDDLTIQGDGQSSTIIDGGGLDRVFHVHSSVSSVTISDVTITNGRETDDNDLAGGGGIKSHYNSTLNLNRVTLTRNLVVGNSHYASGGGIKCLGECNLYDVTLLENNANSGGGISSSTKQLMVYRSTFANNTAYASGGGAVVYGASVFENSTFFGNMSSGAGGALALYGPATEIRFSTFTGNNSVLHGALVVASDHVTIHNSIVAGNTLKHAETQANCFCLSPFLSASYNIDGGSSCGFSAGDNLNNTNPLLNTLADNGGPTLTCMLKSGSPAINHAQATSLNVDQRSFPRTVGSQPDIGSVETDYSSQFSAKPGYHLNGKKDFKKMLHPK
jgi:hypothetical protein